MGYRDLKNLYKTIIICMHNSGMVRKNMIGTCESCEQEKDVSDIEGHLLCKECEEEIVRCDFCNKLIDVNIDTLEDNFGRLSVPELMLPDIQESLKFCNIDCLEGYLKKHRKELKERDRTCGC